MVDNGKLSTIMVTLAVAVLGVFIADPTLLSSIIGEANYARFGALIAALLIAIYNIANPRENAPVTEPVAEVTANDEP